MGSGVAYLLRGSLGASDLEVGFVFRSCVAPIACPPLYLTGSAKVTLLPGIVL